jgi:hypothetical protein
MPPKIHATLGIAAWLAATTACSAAPPAGAPVSVETRPAQFSAELNDGAVVDRIRLRGMLELRGTRIDGLSLSQLSGLAWDDDDRILYAITDKGALFHLQPEIRGGMLTGLQVLKAVTLQEPVRVKSLRHHAPDTEGLDILNGRNGKRGDAQLVVSFERNPRILRFDPDGRPLGEYTLPPPLHDAKSYAGPNLMLESVCVDDELGVLTVPEEPLAGEAPGVTHLFALDGRAWLYPLTQNSPVSAIECLGHRRVLVLERDFGHVFGRNAVSLKRVTLPADPEPDASLEPENIFTLDAAKGYAIDNFEGLAHHRDNRFFLVSDDNDLFVQRTLLLYFEILD